MNSMYSNNTNVDTRASMAKRIGALFMSLALACTMMAAVPRGAQAASSHTPQVSFGTGVIGDPDQELGWDVVYFGTYDSTDDDVNNPTPIAWNVLDPNHDYDSVEPGMQASVMLLTRYVYGATYTWTYNHYAYSGSGKYYFGSASTYEESELKQTMEEFYENQLAAGEQAAIATTVVEEEIPEGSDYGSLPKANLDGGLVFAPSPVELALTRYGFNGRTYGTLPNGNRNAIRIEDVNAEEQLAMNYWTRAPYYYVARSSYSIAANGMTGEGVRPATNVDTSKVLFTSSAVGSKTTELVGTSAANWPENPLVDNTEWRFTLLSDVQHVDVVDAALSGDQLQITYKNATYGENQYLSALVVNGSGDVVSQGPIKAIPTIDDKNGTVTITLPSDFDHRTYTLEIYSEQRNGDYMTDYASEPIAVIPSELTGFITFNLPGQVGQTVIDQQEQQISVALPQGTDLSSLVAEFTVPDGCMVVKDNTQQQSGVSVNDFSDTVHYVVVSPYGKMALWTVYATTDGSSEKQITAFSLAGVDGAIDQDARTIQVEVPFGTPITAVAADVTVSNGAHLVSPEGLVNFDEPVTYTVQAEDGSTCDYTATITVTPPTTGKDIVSLTIDGAQDVVIDTEAQAVTVTYPYGTQTSKFSALKPDIQVSENAILIPNAGKSRDFRTPQLYVVQAQDGSQKAWWVTFTVAKNNAANILTFAIDSQIGETVIDAENHTIELTMPESSNLAALTPRITISPDATISPKSGRIQNFAVPVVYTVTAQDGTVQEWTVTVHGGYASDEAYLQYFAVGRYAATIDQDAKTITLELPAGTDLTALKPVYAESDGAMVTVDGAEQVSGVSVVDFTDPVVYTVTSPSQTTQVQYTVTITVGEQALSSEKQMLSFTLEGVEGLIDDEAGTIALTLPAGTDTSALVAQFAVSPEAQALVAGKVQQSGTTPNNFSRPVVYTVQAEDGSTRTYTVTVTVEEPQPVQRWIRLSGDTRYGTMAAVSRQGFDRGSCDTVILACGASFPDALAASGLAGAYGSPVLLTASDRLSPEAASEIARLGATKVIVLGGPDRVSESVIEELYLVGKVRKIERIAGGNRMETANLIAAQLRELSSSRTAVLAYGGNFADSLSISPYCYASESPIFLVGDSGRLDDATISALRDFSPENILILGGTDRVSDAVRLQLGGRYTYQRLAGADRFGTSIQVARWATGELDSPVSPEVTLSYAHPALATGANFPDGLSVGALCGSQGCVLLLVADTGTGFEDVVRGEVGSHIDSVEQGYLVGDSKSVSTHIEDAVNAMA